MDVQENYVCVVKLRSNILIAYVAYNVKEGMFIWRQIWILDKGKTTMSWSEQKYLCVVLCLTSYSDCNKKNHIGLPHSFLLA